MINVSNLTVKYFHYDLEVVALNNVNLTIASEEFLSIIGPSGCGKSTLLHVLGGFIQPQTGKVEMDGRVITGADINRGIVFQKFSLFPWRTVTQNIQFGLSEKKNLAKAKKEITQFFLNETELTAFANSYPNELSIGMQQRVALARAFANDPAVLLMDEPFASLDAQTRFRMRDLLLKIWEQKKKSVVFVTHDIEEAIILADRILVLSSRPGTIVEEFIIDLPRPRTKETLLLAEYNKLRQKLLSVIFKV